jgi:hypothetical protein
MRRGDGIVGRRLLLTVVTVALALPLSNVHAETPQLAVAMKVDRQKASPEDLLRYEVSVRNLTEETLAHIEMSSHIPTQTTGATDQCPDGTIEPDGDICFAPSVPTPGLGEAVHQVHMGAGPVAYRQTIVFRFAVRIDANAEIGTKIHNHAHAAGDLGGEHESNEVVTQIVKG